MHVYTFKTRALWRPQLLTLLCQGPPNWLHGCVCVSLCVCVDVLFLFLFFVCVFFVVVDFVCLLFFCCCLFWGFFLFLFFVCFGFFFQCQPPKSDRIINLFSC